MPKNPARWLNPLAATVLAAAMGFALLGPRLGEGLALLSYDLPYLCLGKMATSEVIIVYLDDSAAVELQQSLESWDRSLHAKLLDRLTRDGARAVLFDLIFSEPSPDSRADLLFAEAMRRHGRVVLSAKANVEQQFGVEQRVITAPTPALRAAAEAWGLANFKHDADFGARRIFEGIDDLPSVTAATVGGDGAFPRQRWFRFYGPRGTIPNVSYAQALLEDGVPPGFFQGKIVVIGLRSDIGLVPGEDEFAGPWSRWGDRFIPGAEVHATGLLNLLRHDWLERMDPNAELGWLAAFAIFAGVFLNRCTPIRAALAGLLAMTLLAVTAVCAVLFWRLWWAWLIPAAVLIPFGFAWSVGAHYFTEARRRAALRRAFSLYLSPLMADRIAASEFDLTPGGKLVEATIMFTDLEGFTTLSEELDDPAALSAILIRYFSRTTACILENDGTIIKYMGDAVEAVWNAPLEDPEHASKAVLAAHRFREVANFTANGRNIRTRVGINTGLAFAGNLGSEFRFDYAVIGDTTNFAARLESLNKRFGTDILLAETTVEQLGGKFITRPLGRFRVAGKKLPVAIHELVAPVSEPAERPWLRAFAAGLQSFVEGDLVAARRSMEKTRQLHGGKDGPAEFFLESLDELEKTGLPPDWDGVIEFTKK